MIRIYYSHKKLQRILYFPEADMITMKEKTREDLDLLMIVFQMTSNMSQTLEASEQSCQSP